MFGFQEILLDLQLPCSLCHLLRYYLTHYIVSSFRLNFVHLATFLYNFFIGGRRVNLIKNIIGAFKLKK